MLKSITKDLKHYARNLTVLVAEDDLFVAEEIQQMLGMFFKKVYLAHNGIEALEIYKKKTCDIVLTDLEMPRMGGVELTKEIRILSKEQTIFVNSGYIDKYVIDLIDIGIQGLFLKPFKTEEFFQKLLVHCENIQLKKEMEKYKGLISEMARKIEEPVLAKSKVTLNTILREEENNSLEKYIENFGKETKVDYDYWKYISEDVVDLNTEFEETINNISLKGLTKFSKDELSFILSKYSDSLKLIPHMGRMSDVFKNGAITFEDLDLNKHKFSSDEILHLLEYLYDDIMNFFEVVFIDKTTENINYLADSLDSSIIQIKCKLSLIQLEEEDLELF